VAVVPWSGLNPEECAGIEMRVVSPSAGLRTLISMVGASVALARRA